MDRNPQLDRWFSEAPLWRPEADRLREIVLESGLSEELKWGKPCYVSDGRNICIIQRMKSFLALLFFKGALLEDPDGVLEVQGPNSRAGYRMRFTGVRDVSRTAKTVKALIREAIEVEKSGLKVDQPTDHDYPEELVVKLDEDPAFKAAFESLTPGRRRGYLLHFSGARQSKTRAARIEKHRRNILDGKGLNDR